MKILHIHDVPRDQTILWVFSKTNFQTLIGIRNMNVAFVSSHLNDEQTLLTLTPKINILYINPKYVRNPELKNLILRLNPEILL